MTLERLNIATKARFFQAVDTLVERGHSLRSICYETRIDRRNLTSYRTRYDRVPSAWLAIVSAKYGISAEWLLLGKGKMFASKREA